MDAGIKTITTTTTTKHKLEAWLTVWKPLTTAFVRQYPILHLQNYVRANSHKARPGREGELFAAQPGEARLAACIYQTLRALSRNISSHSSHLDKPFLPPAPREPLTVLRELKDEVPIATPFEAAEKMKPPLSQALSPQDAPQELSGGSQERSKCWVSSPGIPGHCLCHPHQSLAER